VSCILRVRQGVTNSPRPTPGPLHTSRLFPYAAGNDLLIPRILQTGSDDELGFCLGVNAGREVAFDFLYVALNHGGVDAGLLAWLLAVRAMAFYVLFD